MSEPTLDPRPAPPVPPHVDLTDFPFFPLDAVRLRDSDLSVKASGDEFKAAVLLWCASWHQVPAASLPNDDALLAKFAGYGRTETEAWKAIRTGALRGFKECGDGRLYHALMAEKANEAWQGKLRLRHKRECERIKKAAQRAGVAPVYPTFDAWCAHLDSTGQDKWEQASGTSLTMSQGTNKGRPSDVPSNVSGSVPIESASDRGQGTGTGDKGQGHTTTQESSLRSDSSSAAPPTGDGQAVSDEAESASNQPPVPYEGILAAYRKHLPQLQQPTILSTKRKRAIKKAWHLLPIQHRKIGAFTAIFAECGLDDFLNGTGPYGGEHAGWRPTFDYLIREETLIKVYERAQHRRAQSRAQGAAGAQGGAT